MFKTNVFSFILGLVVQGVELFLSMLYFFRKTLINTKKSLVAIVLGVDQTAQWKVNAKNMLFTELLFPLTTERNFTRGWQQDGLRQDGMNTIEILKKIEMQPT